MIQKADVKVAVESTGALTRQEQGLDRIVRALRGFSVGIALAASMAHFGVLRIGPEQDCLRRHVGQARGDGEILRLGHVPEQAMALPARSAPLGVSLLA